MQLIILSALIMIPVSSHAFIFNVGCMQFAQMDVFDLADYYEMWFNFKETFPLNDNYELLGMDDMNFMINSGSYFGYAIIIIFSLFSGKIINFCAVKGSKYKIARQIGMKFDENNTIKNSFENNATLLIESYFDLALSGFLNIYAISIAKNAKDLSEFFSTKDDVMNSSLAIIYCLMILFLPTVGFFLICKYQKEFSKRKALVNKFEIILGNTKINTLLRSLYTVFFLYRRFIIVMVLMWIDRFPFFQCSILMLLSILNLAYLVGH